MTPERKQRVRLLLLAIAGLLFLIAALLLRPGTAQYENRLLLLSKEAPAITVQALEDEARPTAGLLTYETQEGAQLQTRYKRVSVELIGTNHAYAAATGYRMRSGGFLTETAQREGLKHIVLNEAAAQQLFGSHNIVGERAELKEEVYLVVGVISDGEKAARAYTILEGSAAPGSLLYAYGGGEALARSALKELGLSTEAYHYVSLSAIQDKIGANARALTYAAFLCMLICVLRVLGMQLRSAYNALKSALGEHYPTEVLRHTPLMPLRLAGLCMLLLCCAGLTVYLSTQLLACFLHANTGIERLAQMRGGFFLYAEDLRLRAQVAPLLLYGGLVTMVSATVYFCVKCRLSALFRKKIHAIIRAG